MKLNVKCSLVKPADPTWKGFIPLSDLDVVENYYLQHLFLYKPTPHNHFEAIVDVFTKSLSKVLVPFHPLAGRLSPMPQGRLQIDCNGKGAVLMEAQTAASLDKLTESDYHQLAPEIVLGNGKPLADIPLVAAQITRFGCGSISVGVTISHSVADAQSTDHFLQEWAGFARGLPLQKQPYFNRDMLAVGPFPDNPPLINEFDPAPLLLGESSNAKQRKKRTVCEELKLTKLQVEMLRNIANGNVKEKEPGTRTNSRRFTRFEALTAHIWRCACRARGHRPEQRTRLNTSVSVRHHSKLLGTYFGTGTIFAAAFDHAGDLMSKQPSYAASRIRELITKVTPAYVHGTLSILGGFDDLSELQEWTTINDNEEGKGAFYGNPNLSVNSLINIPLPNFGFGKSYFWKMFLEDFGDGNAMIARAPDYDQTGSILVIICLQEPHMEAFKTFFYEDTLFAPPLLSLL